MSESLNSDTKYMKILFYVVLLCFVLIAYSAVKQDTDRYEQNLSYGSGNVLIAIQGKNETPEQSRLLATKRNEEMTASLSRDASLPSLKISEPKNGQGIETGTELIVLVDALDNEGIFRIDFFIGDVFFCSDYSAPFGCVLLLPNSMGNTKQLELKAIALDQSGNSSSDSVLISIKEKTFLKALLRI